MIVSYNLKKSSINQKTTIQQVINGYKDYSNNGRYQYQRKGILNTIPSIKLNKGVFIIKFSDKDKILQVLRKNNASMKTFIIEISKNSFIKN